MSEEETKVIEIAVAYHRAWTTGDWDSAEEHLAGDILCHAPSGTMEGKDAVRSFMKPFADSLTASTLLAAYGADHEALIMYDTANRSVSSAPAAELYRIENDHIVQIRIIFDRLPFALARGDVVAV